MQQIYKDCIKKNTTITKIYITYPNTNNKLDSVW